tara:strand:- start:1937 stop:2986 length:1050 start_codon:yes stop_codon:yes gene_type:complete
MGAVNLDNTGSGSAIALSSDGTSLLLDGTAIGGGGGGADLYAANESSPAAQPSATGANAIAIGDGATASGADSVAIGENCTASTTRAMAFGYDSDATGNTSMAIGDRGISSGGASVSIGKSRAIGGNSFAVNINSNTTYGAFGYHAIALGFKANGYGTYSYGIGHYASASGQFSAVLGGTFSNASGKSSYAFGARGKAEYEGKYAFGVNTDGTGASQGGYMVLARESTTDATPVTLTSSGSNGTAGNTNQVVLPNNSAIAFHGTIVARQQASSGTASAAWKIEGLIRREGSASTTVLVSSTTTVLDNTPSWGMTLSADTTNGALKIEVTGASATNIRWVATVSTSEVTY